MLSVIFYFARTAKWIRDLVVKVKYRSIEGSASSPETVTSVGDSPPPSPTLETTQASISSPGSPGSNVSSLASAISSTITQPKTAPLPPIDKASALLYTTYFPNSFPTLPFAAPWSSGWPSGNLLPSLAPEFLNRPWDQPVFSPAPLFPYPLQSSSPIKTGDPPSPDSSSQESLPSNDASSDSGSSKPASSEKDPLEAVNPKLGEIVQAAVENYAKHLELISSLCASVAKGNKRPSISEEENTEKANKPSKEAKSSQNKKIRSLSDPGERLWNVIEEPCSDIDSEAEDTWHRDMNEYNQQSRQIITGEISNETIMENLSTHGMPEPDVPLLPLTISKPESLFVRALANQHSRRQRGEKRPIPDTLKDARYFERRKRNNLAAKKSRDNRKLREDHIAIRACLLEKENAVLRAQVAVLREEAANLRRLIMQKKPHLLQTLKVFDDKCKSPEK